MSEEEFLEILFNDEGVPTDPDKLLAFSQMLYQLHLNADEDSPLRSNEVIDWEQFGSILEEAQAADDNVKEAEANLKRAEEELDQTLRKFLPYN